MKALNVNVHAKNSDDIKIELIERPIPTIHNTDCLIKIISSGINPSDALGAMGYFNHAKLPRIPGRDFSGIVMEGPKHWIGKKVWGTGGAAGISFDGVQAEYIKLSDQEFSEIPSTLDPIVAGAQSLPYVTAYYSLVKRARIEENDTVLVVGALGQVGNAAMSICHWKKCDAIAFVRGEKEVEQAHARGWKAINSEDSNLAEKILASNNGRPVQVILNSLGNLYWQEFINVLAEFGRIVTIGAREQARIASINLFELYRSNQEIIGINTVSLDFAENAKLLNELKIGFEEKKLHSLTTDQLMIHSPQQANEAYKLVAQGFSAKRVVLKFP